MKVILDIKKNAQKRLVKITQTPQKIHTLRLFSHAQSRRLLPKGGRDKPLHLASHKTEVIQMMIIITQHDYGNTRHNTLTLLKVDLQVDVILLADSHRMRVFSCFLQLFQY